MWRRTFLALLSTLIVSACGGGGGGSGGGGAPPVSSAPPPAAGPTTAQLNAASKFASQATFGMTYAEIDALARSGTEAWLDQQLALPATMHGPVVDEFVRRLRAGELPAVDDDVTWLVQFRRFAWWHTTLTAEDQLRQRVAYALSQFFVVSDNVDALIVYPHALATYQDLLLTHAFGNFRDLLMGVSRSPAMGVFLSHINNRKADPTNNIFPDENYAREVMQLFSIGLFELNLDGSLQLDANGQPIPTYDNADIESFARVFTGLSWRGANQSFGTAQPNFREPMRMFDVAHDMAAKTLLRGETLAANQSGDQDLDDAIDNLFHHPNVGPFLAQRLIQRLVTSNPSAGYIERIARVFNGEASGVRGDMAAVVRAILLDPEATTASDRSGKLREPVLRIAALYRQFGAQGTYDYFTESGFVIQNLTRQHPLSSPSVFNFYSPDHVPAGSLADAQLKAPEFQITTAPTVVALSNLIDGVIHANFMMISDPELGTASLTLDEYVTLASEGVEPLIDRLDTVVTYGTLSETTRTVMRELLSDIADPDFRAKTAIYMILTSPDYAVET